MVSPTMSLTGRARRGTVQNATPADGPLLMEATALGPLRAALLRAGYRVIGPTVRDGAIVLGQLGRPMISRSAGGFRSSRAATGYGAVTTARRSVIPPGRSRGSSSCIPLARRCGPLTDGRRVRGRTRR